MSQKQEVNSGALYEIDVLGDKTKFLQYNVKTITVLKSIITLSQSLATYNVCLLMKRKHKMFLKWEKIKYTWNQLHVRMSLTNILPNAVISSSR